MDNDKLADRKDRQADSDPMAVSGSSQSRYQQKCSTSAYQPSEELSDNASVTVAESTPLINQGKLDLNDLERHGTVFSSIFTLVSTMIGGGLLSLPFAFQQGGLILTSMLLFLVLMASTHGGFLIINSKKYCQGKIRNIEDVAKVAFGPKGKFLTQFSLIITLFLCSVAYWILITDQLHPIFTLMCGEKSFWSQRIVVLTIVVIAISPFTLMRSVTSLRYTSVLSVVCVLFLSGAVVYNSAKADIGGDFERPDNPIRWWPKDFGGVITALSITGLVFACHFNILPMHSELRYQTRANKRIILYTAMAITYLLNVVVSFFGYTQSDGPMPAWQFRRYISQDITQNYRNDDIVISVGRCGLALTLILSLPLLVFPCRAIINRLIWKEHRSRPNTRADSWKSRCLHYNSNESWTGPSTTVWVVETALFVAVSYVLAFNIPQVAMVWGFVGAIGTTLMIYILPPAFYLRVRLHPEIPDVKQVAAWLLMIVGFFILVVGTYQSFVNVIHPIPLYCPPATGLVNSSDIHPTNVTLYF